MDYIRSKGGKTDMTKNEYLAALNQALANYSPSFKKDILMPSKRTSKKELAKEEVKKKS